MKFVLHVLNEIETSAYTALQGESLSAECHLNFILLINAESIYV